MDAPQPSAPGSELTAVRLQDLNGATASAARKPRQRRNKKRKRFMARNADRMGVAGSLASPAGSWSGRTPALRSTPRAAVPTPLATPATVPRTAPRAPLNTTQDLIAGKEAASVEHVEPAADGAEPINFFGSNATTTRHFAEEEGDSDDEETQRTDPDSAEQSERIAVLERDMAALTNENQRLQAEVESLRRALHAARQGQPSALVQPGLEALPVSMASTPA